MERTIAPRNISLLCRICLTTSKNMFHLASPIDENASKWTIHEMLETVTFKRIILDEAKFPSKICQMCLSLLKIAYDFQTQFTNSQKVLGKIADRGPVEAARSVVEIVKIVEKEPENLAPVELIVGDKKFDLKDVLVVEEEQSEIDSFEGFLNNLGTEISAKFVNGSSKPKLVDDLIDHSISIEQIPEPSVTTIVKTLYQCRKCQSLFETNPELEDHVENCYSIPTHLMCDKCGHLAHSKSALYHHLQNHKGKRFKCEQCNKAYSTTSRLKSHQQIHKNERPYLCNICGKNFNYKVGLKYHMRLHTGEKKYVCNFCGKACRMSNTLKRHIRTHTREKPYRCAHCERAFSSRGEQRCHEMSHTGEAPYHCRYCDKGFIKSSNLQYHYLTHSGPHECSLCPKTFIDIKFLRLHLKKAHEEIEDGEEVEMIE